MIAAGLFHDRDTDRPGGALDVTSMKTKYNGSDLSGFGDITTFQM